jgi:hypothetical protein
VSAVVPQCLLSSPAVLQGSSGSDSGSGDDQLCTAKDIQECATEQKNCMAKATDPVDRCNCYGELDYCIMNAQCPNSVLQPYIKACDNQGCDPEICQP